MWFKTCATCIDHRGLSINCDRFKFFNFRGRKIQLIWYDKLLEALDVAGNIFQGDQPNLTSP